MIFLCIFLFLFLFLFLLILSYDEFYLFNVVLDDLLFSFSYLSVFFLCGYEIYDLINFFKNLKYLCYLNFFSIKINCLYDFLCSFYYLEILMLSNCLKCKNLFLKISNFVSLYFFDISGVDLMESMFFGFD